MDQVNHSNEIYEKMLRDICSEFMTESEIEKSAYTEVFFSGPEMISRGMATDWLEFIKKDKPKKQAKENKKTEA